MFFNCFFFGLFGLKYTNFQRIFEFYTFSENIKTSQVGIYCLRLPRQFHFTRIMRQVKNQNEFKVYALKQDFENILIKFQILLKSFMYFNFKKNKITINYNDRLLD